ncbi:MAG: hypothetical protein ABR968_11700, partial [Bacteroidales bacterium]
MIKNIKFIFTVAIMLASQIGLIQAQMVGINAYIKGTGVEIGIDGKGGFEGCDTTVSPVPPGMHCRTNTVFFGFVANPQNNAWATFDGDFFTPGTPENGWGITIGANHTSAADNCDYLDQIPGSITSYQHIFNCYIVDWAGSLNNIGVKIEYLLEETDLFYTTTVSITNNTAATIPDMYYYRNLDPDNNVTINGGDYSTLNTIVSQPGTGGCDIAHVSATQSVPWNSYVGFAAAGANWRASYGGFSNRSGYDMWTPTSAFTQTVGSSLLIDGAIQLSYRIQNLAPGATETFKFVVILDDASANQAINNLMYFTYPGSSSAPPAACVPYIDTCVTCGPVVISIAGSAASDYTWAWTPATGLSPTTGTSVTANPTVTTTYTATGTPTNACMTPVSYNIVVKVDPSATLNPVITGPSTICSGNPGTLDAGSGYASYAWSTGSTIETTTVTTTGTYTVTVSNASGCFGTASFTVTVGPLTVTDTSTNSHCGNSDGTATANPVGSGPFTYLWSSVPAQTTQTATNLPAGTYTVTVTCNTCTATASATVVNVAGPSVAFTNVLNSLCGVPNGSATANATGGVLPYTYHWNSIPVQTTQIATNLPAGVYDVTVTDHSGCTAT